MRARQLDCLWPASASAQSVFESQHAGAFPQYRAETVLQSPEVIYAGPQGTDALRPGRARGRSATTGYFIVDMKTLLLDYVLKRKTWESIGAKDLRGPIAMASTDAAKSNSGFTLAQLQLNIIATNDVFSRAERRRRPRRRCRTVRALYDAQGLAGPQLRLRLPAVAAQGGEFHAPLYAGYENQIIQYVVQAGANRPPCATDVRMLYPDPTIYSDHPILALNADAGTLHRRHEGPARSRRSPGRGTASAPARRSASTTWPTSRTSPLAEQIRTTTPPNAEVTLMLLACVKDAAKCT